jgi:hypothetical protein
MAAFDAALAFGPRTGLASSVADKGLRFEPPRVTPRGHCSGDFSGNRTPDRITSRKRVIHQVLPHAAGARTYAGVHDRPLRRLLAWLLTLSAWEAGEPVVRRCFQAQTGPFDGSFGGLSEGVGAEKLIKMATGQRRRRLRHEAAAAAARC